MTPPVNPPAEIDDPEDKKPADWVRGWMGGGWLVESDGWIHVETDMDVLMRSQSSIPTPHDQQYHTPHTLIINPHLPINIKTHYHPSIQ